MASEETITGPLPEEIPEIAVVSHDWAQEFEATTRQNIEQGVPANPKQRFGDKKPPLTYTPLSAQLAMLEALYDGMQKYGPHNWRKRPVEAMTYVDAAERHLQLYKVGEETTRDTLVSNLGAVMACCAILIDSAIHGTMIDNRPISPIEADLLHAGEEWVARLRAAQAQREKNAAIN